MTATSTGLFERRHTHLPAVKDVLVVTLVLALIVGFVVHAVRPMGGEATPPVPVALI